MLMSHSMCGFAPIDQYHMQSAQSVSSGNNMSSATAGQAANQAASESRRASNVDVGYDPTSYPHSTIESIHPTSTFDQPVASPQIQSPNDGASTFNLDTDFATSPVSLQQSDVASSYRPRTSDSHTSVDMPHAPSANPRKDPIHRTASSSSVDSGYRTHYGVNRHSVPDSPDSMVLDGDKQPESKDSIKLETDDFWSTTGGGDSYSPFTSANTTPDGEAWKVPEEHLSQYGFQDSPLFDNVCCPMDTIMEKNPMGSGADDFFFNSLFPMGD